MRLRGALWGICMTVLALGAIAPGVAQAGTQTVTLKSRAFTLSGFKTIFPKVAVQAPRRSGYVTAMDAWLVDGRGRRVSIRTVMLHHIVFINNGKPGGPPKKTSCKGRGGEPFWGTGEEKQPLKLPGGYGYAISGGERWSMQAMLMSHDLRAHTVRVVYKLRIVTASKLKRVKPLWLRANGCSKHPSYDVNGDMPPGGVHKRSHLWRMPLSGRIVAASAHLHGSSLGLTISQPRCEERTLADLKALYGYPGDIVYRARPVLHEPGPIATGHLQSETGIPVRKGEMLRVTGNYDGTRPHPRVMAISHVYVAVDRKAPRSCAPLPRDARIFWTREDGRMASPAMDLPLNGLGSTGKVVEIQRPPGPLSIIDGPVAQVALRNERFVPANLSVKAGTVVRWRFDDRDRHNVTYAGGPRLVASPNAGRGYEYKRRLEIPGTYRLFCYLHPITMTQVITVRP